MFDVGTIARVLWNNISLGEQIEREEERERVHPLTRNPLRLET